jgi:hypothetical protein
MVFGQARSWVGAAHGSGTAREGPEPSSKRNDGLSPGPVGLAVGLNGSCSPTAGLSSSDQDISRRFIRAAAQDAVDRPAIRKLYG